MLFINVAYFQLWVEYSRLSRFHWNADTRVSQVMFGRAPGLMYSLEVAQLEGKDLFNYFLFYGEYLTDSLLPMV